LLKIKGIAILILLTFFATAPMYLTTYWISLLISIFMYACLGGAWNILAGPTKYISLGSAAFFGLGAYLTSILLPQFPHLLLIGIAAGLNFLISFVLGFVALRLRGIYFVILTFALGEFIKGLFLWIEADIVGFVGRYIRSPYAGPEPIYYLLLLILILVISVNWWLKNSRFGLALLSIGEGEEKAETLGVNTALYKSYAFALSSMFIGAVGATVIVNWLYIHPSIVFNPLYSFNPAIMVLLGGMGTVYGPIIGAAVLGLLSEYLLTLFPEYYTIILGLSLIFIVLFLPQGIVGALRIRRRR